MSRNAQKAKIVVVIAIAVLAVLVLALVIPRINPPKPQQHSFHIFAGHVARTWIQDSASQTGRPGTFQPPILPHHVLYESSSGEVGVYVVKLTGNTAQQVTEMTELTNQLQSGHPPDSYIAHAAGNSGRLDLHSWPYGKVKYLLLVRSEQDSDVTIVVKYGP